MKNDRKIELSYYLKNNNYNGVRNILSGDVKDNINKWEYKVYANTSNRKKRNRKIKEYEQELEIISTCSNKELLEISKEYI